MIIFLFNICEVTLSKMSNAVTGSDETDSTHPTCDSPVCTDLVSIAKDEEDVADDSGPTSSNLSLFDDKPASSDNSEYVSKLEGLGPIILNTDGTMGRIPNWAEYTESEKAQAIRLIGARNKKRKDALLQAKMEAVAETVLCDSV